MTEETWQYQGRQQHGWWGHGTAPHDDKPDKTRASGNSEGARRRLPAA